MPKKIMITCDSTCDLSAQLIQKYEITVHPLPITLGNQMYLDGIEVTVQDLFDYVAAHNELPRTSAPNPSDYMAFFKPLADQGFALIHFVIGSGFSSSVFNAATAASELEDVYVIDAMNLSSGIALLAVKAAELAASGLPANEIVDQINALRNKVDASFVIDTCEYLYKGGRCSALAALGANLLKLKPCIEVRESKMGVGKKYRGRVSDVILDYVDARLATPDDIDATRIFVTHTCRDDAMVNAVVEKIKALHFFDEILVTSAGCTISVHCGPDTLGVLFIRKTPVE